MLSPVLVVIHLHIRLALVDIGWDLFYQSPITGVGVNNPSVLTYFLYGKENYYLHNNYIELLAGTGIIGLLAYYSMYVYIAYNLIRYRNFHSNEYRNGAHFIHFSSSWIWGWCLMKVRVHIFI